MGVKDVGEIRGYPTKSSGVSDSTGLRRPVSEKFVVVDCRNASWVSDLFDVLLSKYGDIGMDGEEGVEPFRAGNDTDDVPFIFGNSSPSVRLGRLDSRRGDGTDITCPPKPSGISRMLSTSRSGANANAAPESLKTCVKAAL